MMLFLATVPLVLGIVVAFIIVYTLIVTRHKEN